MPSLSPESRARSWRTLCAAGAGVLLLSAGRLSAQQPEPQQAMPDSVREYLDTALALFRRHSVHRAEVDWQAVQDSVFAGSAGAQTPAGTWQALSRALRRVDSHSFLLPPAHMRPPSLGGTASAPPQPAPPAPPEAAGGGLLEGRIGVVAVPPIVGNNRTSYVDSLQARIAALDSAGACGWVVDLRQNTGGNMWPMLAGIGPLLGGEAVGSFTDSPPGRAWRYRDGRSWFGDSTSTAAHGWGSTPPRPLTHLRAPVAVLTGRRTSSSGEMTLLAFLGRPDLRTFGDTTSGAASANANVPLRDGAMLIITAAYPRDRLGRRYPLRIAPDEFVSESGVAGQDAPLLRASAWLRRHPACAPRE